MPTKIEWAEGVWNPVTGCTKISPGCQNCYAERMAKRLAGRCGYPADDPFKVTLHPDRLGQPLRWTKPRRIFVCSMGDLFHEDVPDWFLDKVFAVMAKASKHKFLLLTKRPERMRDYILKAMYDDNCNYDGWYEEIHRLGIPDVEPMLNVWLGVTAENQEQADKRIPILLQIPAAVRFVSVEPMLDIIDMDDWLQCFVCGNTGRIINHGVDEEGIEEDCPCCDGDYPLLDWVICGGESGPGARPMHPNWVRDLKGQCQNAGVPFLFKQWGEYCYPEQMTPDAYNLVDAAHNLAGHGDYSRPWKVGKHKAGRLLDGKLWDEYPSQLEAER